MTTFYDNIPTNLETILKWWEIYRPEETKAMKKADEFDDFIIREYEACEKNQRVLEETGLYPNEAEEIAYQKYFSVPPDYYDEPETDEDEADED